MSTSLALERAPLQQLTGIATEPEIGMSWLWRLRWAALVGLGPMLVIARLALGMQLHLLALAGAAGLSALANVALKPLSRRATASNGLLLLVLLADALWLTGVLYLSGGAENPFSALFIIHVAVASLLLGPRSGLLLTAFTSLCFGVLLLVSEAAAGAHVHGAFPRHLRGMWVAHVLSATFVAYFVSRIAAALRRREAEMASLRRYLAGMERIASLSTMATGAAHELGSPLSSIAVSAAELSEALARDSAWAAYADEARNIRDEVTRCRAILDRLTRGAGQQAGEAPEAIDAAMLVQRLKRELGAAGATLLDVEHDPRLGPVRSPPVALVQSLTSLIRNGMDAGRANGGEGRVRLCISAVEGCATFDVMDQGAGIPQTIADRMGEPFLSTKPVGTGMGLGVFLARAFSQQVGGYLTFQPLPAGGTWARLRLGPGSCAACAGME